MTLSHLSELIVRFSKRIDFILKRLVSLKFPRFTYALCDIKNNDAEQHMGKHALKWFIYALPYTVNLRWHL